MTTKNVFKKDNPSSAAQTVHARLPTTFCNGEDENCSTSHSVSNIPISSSLPAQSNTLSYLLKDHISICKYRYNAFSFQHQRSPVPNEDVVDVEVVNLEDPVALDRHINEIEEEEENKTIDLGELFLNSNEVHAAQSSRLSSNIKDPATTNQIPRQSQYFRDHIKIKSEHCEDILDEEQTHMPKEVRTISKPNIAALQLEKVRSVDSLVSAESTSGRSRAGCHAGLVKHNKTCSPTSVSGGTRASVPSSSHEQNPHGDCSRKNDQTAYSAGCEKRRSIINIFRAKIRNRGTHTKSSENSAKENENGISSTQTESPLASESMYPDKKQDKRWCWKRLFSCLKQRQPKKSMESKDQTTPMADQLELEPDRSDEFPVNTPALPPGSRSKLEGSRERSEDLLRPMALQHDGHVQQNGSMPNSSLDTANKPSSIDNIVTGSSRNDSMDDVSSTNPVAQSQLELESGDTVVAVPGSPVTSSNTATEPISNKLTNTFKTVEGYKQQTSDGITVDGPRSLGSNLQQSNVPDGRGHKRASTMGVLPLLTDQPARTEWSTTGDMQRSYQHENSRSRLSHRGSALRAQTDLGVGRSRRPTGEKKHINHRAKTFGPRLSQLFSEGLSSMDKRSKPISHLMSNIRRAGNGENVFAKKEKSGDRESPWGIPNDDVDDSNVNSKNYQIEKIRKAVRHGIENVRVEKRSVRVESDDRYSTEESIPESTIQPRPFFNRALNGNIDVEANIPDSSNIEMSRDEFVDFITSSPTPNRRPKWPNLGGIKK